MKKIGLYLLIGLIAFQACKPKSDNVVNIGAILPLTGYAATNGQMSQRAIDLAIDSLNQTSKIKYKVIYEDSKSLPKDAATCYKKLHAQGVKYLIGFGGATLYSFIPETNNKEELLFATATPNVGILELSNRCLRVYPNVPMVTGRILDYVKENGYKNVALLYIQNEVYAGYANTFKKQIEETGQKLCFYEGYDPSTTDYKNIINKLLASKPDCIYLASTGESTGVVIRQIFTDGRMGNVPIVGDISLANSENVALMGEIKTPVYIVNGPISDDFNQLFKAKYGSTPNAFAAYSYAIPFMIDEAITTLGIKASVEQIYNHITESAYESAIGRIAFDIATHEPKLELVIEKL